MCLGFNQKDSSDIVLWTPSVVASDAWQDLSVSLLKSLHWNLLQYCHYVAGLVGIGLSRLFSASEFEDPLVGEDTECANSMGLFLQKTNIIRDYLEDQLEGREFWPQEVTDMGCLGENSFRL